MTWTVVALWAAAAGAQDPAYPPTSLKAFLVAADQQNVDRRITAEQRNRAAAEHRQAWTALFPSLSASGGWTHNQYAATASFPDPSTGMLRQLTIVPEDQLDANLRFELPLVDTGRWFRAMAAAKSEEASAQRDLVMLGAVWRQVASTWYGYAASLAVRESAKKSAGVAEAQLKLMEIRAGAGAVTELELLRARAEVQRTRQVVADAESLVATSRRSLRTLSGLEPPAQLTLPEDDLRPEPPVEELEARLDQLPAVQAADRDLEAAGRVAAASKLAVVPIVAAQYTQRFTNATGFQGQSAVYNAGLTFQWRLDVPTFMGMQAQSANEQTARLAGEKARLQARDTIYSDYQRLTAAMTKVVAARAQVEAAQRAAQVAKDRYAAGAATQVDVIQAERDVFGAEVGQIQARTELGTARTLLRISTALPLD